ncbi:MAG: helix-turn-helix transcriptional regulator [Microcoleus sp. PH2017_15_JOR_U_A]|uniref:helix-turn-helix domain-containing protein n=1 Tax=unclassified Microcoleus TaxID=2642155 RepID=UPI001DE8158A|nr:MULTISPECIES: helix-turn-helix transcriptional regulator [unclassified Microcoleus]TAE72307.1 MAG: XRE family transcriptional regulator [Oscillatoriales cyanobacterium]MCC3471932.1 helix-turn-helix transcriptional regulator [Microcoleus sp. PH2017_13_LAR_U_A]MCC3484477.1 helix-turn-helix transcriptional regulator [Microcoleus sp. PH2017_14_LAR_D_A]MCC3489010.1 helix-turn-helix transcriptional regulator [Microcoleus sp. PH2017_16_JOR_D_A]MCC3497890.1 helix-turn-helix transcriptional regulato
MTKIDGKVSDLLAAILAEPEAMVNANTPETLKPTTAEELQQKLEYFLILDSLGELLQKIRSDRGLTVREMAREVQKSPGRISQIEGTLDRIELKTLAQYANELGYDVQIALVPRNDREPALFAPIPLS